MVRVSQQAEMSGVISDLAVFIKYCNPVSICTQGSGRKSLKLSMLRQSRVVVHSHAASPLLSFCMHQQAVVF